MHHHFRSVAFGLVAITAGCSKGSDPRASAGTIGSSSLVASATAPAPLPPRVTVSGKWSFGVMADTQWIDTDDGKNPNSTAVDIINQVNEEFIKRGVKLVVALGDLTDQTYRHAEYLDTRATYAQAIYNAGIGFYPLRGNHDEGEAAAREFVRVFPQTQSGANNRTPRDAFVSTADDANTHPAPKTGPEFALGDNFTSPSPRLTGLSYAFDVGGARFVLLDQFKVPGGPNSIASQQPWITKTLAERPAGSHAFVFSHKGLITESHVDNLFGESPAENGAAQDAFITSLAQSGVRYFMHGHDHMHDRTLVATTDGKSAHVTQLLCASDSSKFYIPSTPSNDDRLDKPTRQTPLSQELKTVGYYVVTIDGPAVTVDFYSAEVAAKRYNAQVYYIETTPKLAFTKRETFGYSQNGHEFVVAEGAPYTTVEDSFGSTKVRILAGKNENTAKDGSGRPFSKAINTGFSAKTEAIESDVVSLWGMASAMGSPDADAYALAITFQPAKASKKELEDGSYGVVSLDESGQWRSAVAVDEKHPAKFVSGPWAPAHRLGTYGFDSASSTAWAVVNRGGTFAVARVKP